MRFCAACGGERVAASLFCTGCGTRFPADDATHSAAAVSQGHAATQAARATPLPQVDQVVTPGMPHGGSHSVTPQPGSSQPSQTPSSPLADLELPGGTKINPKIAKMVGIGIGAVIALIIIVKVLGALLSGGAGSIFLVLALLLAGVIGFFAYTSHRQETREARTVASLPPSVQHVVAQMEPGARSAFFNEYERYRKKTWVAYLLMWPLFGTHYFYLRQPLLNVLYWFTGAGGGIWGLIDLFRMRSLVRTANEQSARQALQTLHVGAVFSSMPAAPRAMTQPVPPMYAPAAPPIPPMQPAHPTPQDR